MHGLHGPPVMTFPVPSLTPFLHRRLRSFAILLVTGILELSLPAQGQGTTIVGALSGSPYVVGHWDVKDGLASDSILALARTPDGYIWIGTTKGLMRFDGVRFTPIGENRGVPTDGIRSLLTDLNGRLWIRGRTKQILVLGPNGVTPRETDLDVIPSVIGEDGGIYGWKGDRIVRFTDGDPIVTRAPKEFPEKKMFRGLHVDRQGAMRLIAEKGIWKYENGHWTEPEGIMAGHIEAYTGDGDGGWWIVKDRWIVHHVKKDGTVEVTSIPPEGRGIRVEKLAPGPGGTLWGTTFERGLWTIDSGGYRNVPLSLLPAQVAIECLFVDPTGTVWVGTSDSGLYRITTSLVSSYNIHPASGGGMINALCEPTPGTFIVGAETRGFFKWTREGPVPLSESIDPFQSIPGNCLLKHSNGSLWVGIGERLYRFKSHRDLGEPDLSLSFGTTDGLLSLCEARDGAVWAGGTNGKLFRIEDGRLVRTEQPVTARITAMQLGPDGTIWVGTLGAGLLQINGGDGRITRDPPPELNRKNISALHFDEQGRLWVGTPEGGLYRRMEDGKFRRVLIRGGSPADAASQILDDGRGWLWYGNNRGISGIDLEQVEEQFTGKRDEITPVHFGLAEGMPSESCTMMQPLHGSDNQLYFGTIRGFVSFDPVKMLAPPPIPVTAIEELHIAGQEKPVLLPGTPPELMPEGRFEIHFTGLDPSRAEIMRFRYRLREMELDWVEGGQTRFASYTHVPPGRYHFEVQAGNRFGQWSAVPATLDLVVRPHFWQTWWFATLGVLLTAALLIGPAIALERRRMNKVLAVLERKRAVDEERRRIARDLHDGIGAGLTHVGLLASGLDQNETGPESPSLSDQVCQQLRSVARDLDIAVWAANPSYDDLESFCSYLEDYAAEIFSPSSIQLRISRPQGMPALNLTPNCRHQLFMIAKEAINNLLKYSEARQATLSLDLEQEVFRITISDNGRGFPMEEALKKKRHGLECMRQRAESVGATFGLASEAGRGTTLTIRMPLDRMG